MSGAVAERRPECFCCIEPTPAVVVYTGDRAARTPLCAGHQEVWQDGVDGNPDSYEEIGEV